MLLSTGPPGLPEHEAITDVDKDRDKKDLDNEATRAIEKKDFAIVSKQINFPWRDFA